MSKTKALVIVATATAGLVLAGCGYSAAAHPGKYKTPKPAVTATHAPGHQKAYPTPTWTPSKP